MATQVARLTPLDKIAVGDKIYSKVIFNVRQTQCKPPSQQEYLLLDNGNEFRFYEDGTIWFKRSAGQPEMLFDGVQWLKSEVICSGTVKEVFMHKDPVEGYPTDGTEKEPGVLYVDTQHPHVNYGWYDKASSKEMSPNFFEREEYKNIGLPNEAFLATVKRLAEIVLDLAAGYAELNTEVENIRQESKDAIEYVNSWRYPDIIKGQLDWLRATGYADWAKDDDALWAAAKEDYDNFERVIEDAYIKYCAEHGKPDDGPDTYMPPKYAIEDWNADPWVIILNERYLYYYPDAVLDENDEEYQQLKAQEAMLVRPENKNTTAGGE